MQVIQLARASISDWLDRNGNRLDDVDYHARSACSKLWVLMPWVRFSMTRWDNTIGASSLMSSGRQ